MIPLLLIASVTLLTAAVAVTFWDEIKAVLKTGIEHIRKNFKKSIILGVKTFIKELDSKKAFRLFLETFIENENGKLQKVTLVEDIDDLENIPEDILKKMKTNKNKERVDISEELELELKDGGH